MNPSRVRMAGSALLPVLGDDIHLTRGEPGTAEPQRTGPQPWPCTRTPFVARLEEGIDSGSVGRGGSCLLGFLQSSVGIPRYIDSRDVVQLQTVQAPGQAVLGTERFLCGWGSGRLKLYRAVQLPCSVVVILMRL